LVPHPARAGPVLHALRRPRSGGCHHS